MKKILLLCIGTIHFVSLVAMEQKGSYDPQREAHIQQVAQYRADHIRLQYEVRLSTAQQNNVNQQRVLQQQEQELRQLRAQIAELEREQGSGGQPKRFISLAQWTLYERYAQVAVAVLIGFAGGMWWSSSQPNNEKKQDQK